MDREEPKKKNKKQKKRKRERERKKKEKEKEESRRDSSPNFRRSDGRNSLDQEVKSIYLMRATLQEVGILPTWVYFHHKGYLAGFLLMMRLPCFHLTLYPDFWDWFLIG